MASGFDQSEYLCTAPQDRCGKFFLYRNTRVFPKARTIGTTRNRCATGDRERKKTETRVPKKMDRETTEVNCLGTRTNLRRLLV